MVDRQERYADPAIAGVLPAGLAEQEAELNGPTAEPPVSLDEWQLLVMRIFARNNAFMSPETIWLRVVEESGEFAEALRKLDYQACELVLADLLAWVLAFANKVGITVADAAWAKYPGLCPYCAPESIDRATATSRASEIQLPGSKNSAIIIRPCSCPELAEYPGYDPTKVQTFRDQRTNKPSSIGEWQALFYGIYGRSHQVHRTPDPIAYHLQEEIAEVAKEIRWQRFQEAQEEVADVFSWILCLASLIGYFRESRKNPSPLEAILWAAYPGRCKVCQEQNCCCDQHAQVRRRTIAPPTDAELEKHFGQGGGS